MKVLFIDDDSMMLRMAGFILKKGGHEAFTAESGAEGLRLIEEWRPELVFIDVEMPQMNGFETLEAIKKSGNTELRVCMMSGTVNDEITEQALRLGAEGVIEKPLNAAEVNAVINRQ
ncbi:MAG: response regulator [Ruminococcus sp.]|nr:response regulator [Ruminococcus sp.]